MAATPTSQPALRRRLRNQFDGPGSTTTSVVSSQHRRPYGQSITFTATIGGESGGRTPTGTVTFKDGTIALGTGAGGGRSLSGHFRHQQPGHRRHSITAVYGGDANFTGTHLADDYRTSRAIGFHHQRGRERQPSGVWSVDHVHRHGRVGDFSRTAIPRAPSPSRTAPRPWGAARSAW